MATNLNEMYGQMESEYRSTPTSRSEELWELQYETDMRSRNPNLETILEKSVAMLAKRGHMPGYYNQCPAASGIFGPHKYKRRAVDLVHWSESESSGRLIELKWPRRASEVLVGQALDQILCYGVLYVFCRVHRRELSLDDRPLMDARCINLEIVAPARFYGDSDRSDSVAEMNECLDVLVRSKIGDALSIYLDVMAYPPDFDQIPFASGEQAKAACDRPDLTRDGRRIRDAFGSLSPVWRRR